MKLLLLLLVLLPVGGQTVHGGSPSGPLYVVQMQEEINALHGDDDFEYDFHAHYQPS